MPRPIAASQPHPSPRFKDNIRLRQGRRGPDDLLWSATFCIDGQWQTKKPISLGTIDFNEACEVARDKYAAMSGRGIEAIIRPYARAKPTVESKPMLGNDFAVFADKAVATLEGKRDEAKAVNSGKAKNFTEIIRRVRDLKEKWGGSDITKLTEHMLNDWIKAEYRLANGNEASRSTLGNLDWAFLHVWTEAADAKIVERRSRPHINKKVREDKKTRAFIDHEAVLRLGRLMTTAWVNTPPVDGRSHSVDAKRTFRCYVAMLACTGIRAGLEANRVRIGYVRFMHQEDKEFIIIHVEPRQGKRTEGRDVIVYEGNEAFDIRRLLTEQIAVRRDQGATARDYLFARPDGSFYDYRDIWADVTRQADCKVDPMTGEARVPYSLRHYFATECIARGLTVPMVAEWLGTSSEMIDKHYKRYFLHRDAHNLNGRAMRLVNLAKISAEPWESYDDISTPAERHGLD